LLSPPIWENVSCQFRWKDFSDEICVVKGMQVQDRTIFIGVRYHLLLSSSLILLWMIGTTGSASTIMLCIKNEQDVLIVLVLINI
jgi:hypothetical protein